MGHMGPSQLVSESRGISEAREAVDRGSLGQ